MYNCEIFSVLNNDDDKQVFADKLDKVAEQLYKRDIRVMYDTDIAADAKEISKALYNSQESQDAPDYFIFCNALHTTDASSFKSLFYDFIKTNEQRITPDEDHQGMTAKVKISTITDLGQGYPGYCFRIFDKRYLVLPSTECTKTDLPQLISKAVELADGIFEKNEEEAPDGLVFVEKKQRKDSFLLSFIPHKGDSKNTKIRKTVSLVAIFIFVFAAGYLLNEFVIKPYMNSQITSEIYDIAYTDTVEEDDGEKESAQNWKALKKINKEIVGWITLEGTTIDYPVLEHKGDNASSQYYLYRTYKKTSSSYGSVFVDYRCPDSVNSKNVVLHGHNMPDSMFNPLMGYGKLEGNLNFYKKHPVIQFNTPEGDATYKIISVFKTSTLYAHGEFFNYMQGEFLSSAEFMNFVYNCRIRSLINCPVMVNEDDQLLTLSTCSYEFSQWRTVVVARKVREGESTDVNVEIATLNPSPVFPDVYYQSRGGKRPKVLTFKKANAKGKVTWYDGEGKLEGSEVLTETVKSNPTEPPTDKTTKKPVSSITTYYQVKFVNWDGSEYQSFSVAEGSSVTPPSGTPKLPSDEYYNYTFTGWQTDGLNLNDVQYSMTIYPDFKATLKK